MFIFFHVYQPLAERRGQGRLLGLPHIDQAQLAVEGGRQHHGLSSRRELHQGVWTNEEWLWDQVSGCLGLEK